MKKISILRNGVITNQASFLTSEELEQWFDNHKAMGTFGDDYEAQITDNSEAIELEKQRLEALAYLAATDWMVIRFHETGIAYPEAVKTARSQARVKV